MKQNNNDPLDYTNKMFAEMQNHSVKLQMCVLNDLKTVFEAKQFI